METIHIFKRDVRQSTRVLMQCRWDMSPLVLHRGPKLEEPVPALPLNLINIWSKTKGQEIKVLIHEQGALIYLLLIKLISVIRRHRIELIYDIHDIMEPLALEGNSFFSFMKNRTNLYLEKIAMRFMKIRSITVSQGLSEYYEMQGSKPNVVRNIPEVKVDIYRGQSGFTYGDSKFCYFGYLSRFPFEILDELEATSQKIDQYGPKFDTLKNIDLRTTNGQSAYHVLDRYRNVVREHLEFTQSSMDFLRAYDFLIISMNEQTDNLRYSLPNKVFQALANGLRVIAFGDFVELKSFLSGFPDRVKVQEYNNGALQVAVNTMIASDCQDQREALMNYLLLAREDAKKVYLHTVYSC